MCMIMCFLRFRFIVYISSLGPSETQTKPPCGIDGTSTMKQISTWMYDVPKQRTLEISEEWTKEDIKKAKAYGTNLRCRRATRVNHRYGWAMNHTAWSCSEEGQRWQKWLQVDDSEVKGSFWDNSGSKTRRTQRLEEHINKHGELIKKTADAAVITSHNIARLEAKANKSEQDKCDAELQVVEANAALRNLETRVLRSQSTRKEQFSKYCSLEYDYGCCVHRTLCIYTCRHLRL